MEAVLTQLMGMDHAGAPDLRVQAAAILRLADDAAAVAGTRHAGGRVVTAGIDRVAFHSAAHVGEVLNAAARVNAVWRTSAEVGVRITAGASLNDESRHVLSAYFTMVAIDGDGRPAAMPPFVAVGPEAYRRERAANDRRDGRSANTRRPAGGAR